MAAARRPPEEIWLSFSAEIVPKTTESLLAACSKAASVGVRTVYLLLSTPGGQVDSGINAYNVLRGMPFRLVTHNAGSVNSIGNVLFLAGEERYACPNSTFMFHGVGFDVSGKMRFEEKQLREHLDGIEANTRKIGAVIVDRTDITEEEAQGLFLQAETKDTGFAQAKGIIQDVREIQIPEGAAIQQFVFER